jgi:uncharacterized protein with GYD domain
LYKLTEQGVKNIKDAPAIIKENIKIAESMGCKFINFYTTMGQYDHVAIGEAPSDQVYMSLILRICAQGNGQTTTLKAFTKEEFEEIIKNLP